MFRQDDKPLYLNGLKAVLTLELFSALLAFIGILVFWYSNKKGLGETNLPGLSAEIELAETDASGKGTRTVVVYKKFQYNL